jgi:hypothetical protein
MASALQVLGCHNCIALPQSYCCPNAAGTRKQSRSLKLTSPQSTCSEDVRNVSRLVDSFHRGLWRNGEADGGYSRPCQQLGRFQGSSQKARRHFRHFLSCKTCSKRASAPLESTTEKTDSRTCLESTAYSRRQSLGLLGLGGVLLGWTVVTGNAAGFPGPDDKREAEPQVCVPKGPSNLCCHYHECGTADLQYL